MFFVVIRYAIAMSLQNKQRVIYTTPIKVNILKINPGMGVTPLNFRWWCAV